MALFRLPSSGPAALAPRGHGLLLRAPQMSDYQPWAQLRESSRAYLTPWEPIWPSDDLTRAGFRRRGVSRALAGAAVTFARERGARALEGYPMITHPGHDIAWGELHVGSRSIFAAAGFSEVHQPTLRRVVMRIDF